MLENQQIKVSSVFAVAVGQKPGVYLSLKLCQIQTDNYPDAKYKSFSDVKQAVSYLLQHGCTLSSIYVYSEDSQSDIISFCQVNNIQLLDTSVSTLNDNIYPDKTDPKLMSGNDQSHVRGPSLDGVGPVGLATSHSDGHYLDCVNQLPVDNMVETDTLLAELSDSNFVCDKDNGTESTDLSEDIVPVQSNKDSCDANEEQRKYDTPLLHCTSCTNPVNKHMISCEKCLRLCHYICSELPMYQIHMYRAKKRKYTCKSCIESDTIEHEKNWCHVGKVQL